MSEDNIQELDQFQIIQEILSRSICAAERGWREMIIDYYIEGSQSDICGGYLIEKHGAVKEEALRDAATFDALNVLLRKLQEHLAQAGKPPFTSCRLHMTSDGKYEAKYGYDTVDWNALVTRDWLFPKNK